MSRRIVILGAGKSSIALIDYLLEHARSQQWTVTVADISAQLAQEKTQGRENTEALAIDLSEPRQVSKLIEGADIVISMLPATLHQTIAGYCLQFGKNLVTPSYISPSMREMSAAVEKKGLVFMNEMGLDPGIDHMSAMQIFDRLRSEGAEITGFESHCGGLVSPESDDNAWHYKFSWNPRNVVVAGQGDGFIRYLKNGKPVELSYLELFESAFEFEVNGYGTFESYPNRDSLKYVAEYGLEDVQTMYRGTLRRPPFCKGWDIMVKAGLTDDKLELHHLSSITFTDYFEEQLKNKAVLNSDLAKTLIHPIFNNGRKIPFNSGTAAKVLQALLEEKWRMKPGDKDLVVMVHNISYRNKGVKKQVQSSLVYTGKDSQHTAMSITVGLPVAIITKMILNGEVKRKGVLMPKYADVYEPVMKELQQLGIAFTEKEIT